MDFKGELYSVIIVHRTVLRLLRELESCAGLEGMGEGGGGVVVWEMTGGRRGKEREGLAYRR